MTPEGRVKKIVKDCLQPWVDAGMWLRMPVVTGHGRRLVDFLGCWRGRFFVIEAKRGDKRKEPTPLQTGEMDAVRASGAPAFIVRKREDMDEVFKWLHSIS